MDLLFLIQFLLNLFDISSAFRNNI